ncbi:alpha/beta hydrolase [Thiohalocapsa marina]|uniref:Alpha/beta hydrolase n=1 Tax=Thiohalocapsa marina TaxID=424902 RepID=A0A5M8FQR3_9GAMM|nr:alpha/beta hydrolase [Thiohalocapsa marina]KAA6186216.1 alpha/beta hydrolase [Thiohalocapsa marina]
MDSTDAPTQQLRFLTLADGRRLAFSEFGAPDGQAVLYCHGFPSSRHEARLLHDQALRAGARIIAADRPGYGRSDPQPGRCILDWADDLTRLADHLQLDRFALLGVSGGGPYALAGAARAPTRIAACALVCPLGPIYIDSVLSQMNWAVRTNLMIGRQPHWLGDLLFGMPTTIMLHHWPHLVEDVRSIAAPPADRVCLAEGNNAEILNQTIADAMAHGARGAREDLVLYAHDWQIPFSDISLPIHIWHGSADGTVPVEHARWYAEHLSGARLTELPDEGHYSVPLGHGATILKDLLADPLAVG